MLFAVKFQGFSCGSVAKKPPANGGDMGSIPDLGRSHMPQSNQACSRNHWARALGHQLRKHMLPGVHALQQETPAHEA